MKKLTLMTFLVLLALVFVLAGCEAEEKEVTREVTREVEREMEVEVTREVEVEVTRIVEEVVEVEVTAPVEEVEMEPEQEVPFQELWEGSAHAAAEDEAFVHWDEDDPAEVPVACAKCHSTPGYQDFLGADGTEAGVVDNPAPIGTTVECAACHNPVAATHTSVVMPSGIELVGLGAEARCIECHQGRHSTVSVNASIEEAGLMDDPDAVSEDLGFSNIHYYAAAATMYGTLAKGGYEYDGKSYDGKFDHAAGYSTCVDCHSPHSLELRVEECSQCHTDVASVEDLPSIRMAGSLVDYDGDGNIEEGIGEEIATMQETLLGAMQTYASEVAGTAIVYDSHSYPYFFIDTNENGEPDEDEAAYPNRYTAWTARLAKAAYNYQTSLKDPGAYAHGGKYIIQLLYDSIEDLNADLVAGMHRIDHGHFAGSEEAFRHWDEDGGVVPASCAKCHTAEGLPFFLQESVSVSTAASNGFDCSTCHNDLAAFTTYEVADVTFPSGATVALDDPNANLCLECHQGRQSTVSVNQHIQSAGVGDDEVSENIGFRNVHYFAAGATLFGTEVQGAYEYEGNEYVGRFEHVPAYDTCIECHSTHQLIVKVDECAGCHQGVESAEDLAAIRMDATDYDGDGNTDEGIAGEIETMQEALYAALQTYAVDTTEAGIVYDSHSYPYFFVDANGNGEPDPDEANYGNRYTSWTPAMLRAAYNYQYAQKDPGAYTHNARYIIQALYDSIQAIGGDVGGMTRP